jgi:hypothetical protein
VRAVRYAPSPMPRSHRLRLALLALALSACGSPSQPEPPHLLYAADPKSLDNPFPDARLLTGQGLELSPDWYRPYLLPRALTPKMVELLNQYTVAARDLDGLGNFGTTLLRPSVPVDAASLKGVAARLVRSGDGAWSVLERDVAVEHSRDALEGTGKTAPEGYPEFLVVRPSLPLPEDAEGMLVILRGLKTSEGELLGRGFDFEAEPDAAPRVELAAAALGVAPEEVLLALPLRPARALPTMRGLVDWTRNGAAPSFSIPARELRADKYFVGRWRAGEDDWSALQPWLTKWTWANPAADVGEVVVGTFRSRDVRSDGIFRADWVADPAKAPEAELLFILTLPAGPKPAGGWPFVIGAHGLGGRNTAQKGSPQAFCLEVAQVLASIGHGCLGVDAVEHGARGSSFDFFALDDLRRTRDNFRQSAFDLMQLVSLSRVLDVEGDGVPDLSSSAGLFANSLGGIMGGSLASVDERIRYAALNVPGGGLANILASTDIRDRIGLLLVSKTNLTFESPEYYGAFPLFRTVGQLFLETADPVNVGRAFHGSGRALLIQEGVEDHVIPNFTTEALARAMGAQLQTTSVAGATPLQAHVRVDPARYGLPEDYNGHNVFWDIAPARIQVLSFLGSSGTKLVLE